MRARRDAGHRRRRHRLWQRAQCATHGSPVRARRRRRDPARGSDFPQTLRSSRRQERCLDAGDGRQDTRRRRCAAQRGDADHRAHRRRRRGRLRARHRARASLRRGGRRHSVRRGAAHARAARRNRQSALQSRAADGQHGRRRSDPDPFRPGPADARFQARHLPRRHRARAGLCGAGFLRRAQARRHDGRLSQPHVRFPGDQRHRGDASHACARTTLREPELVEEPAR